MLSKVLFKNSTIAFLGLGVTTAAAAALYFFSTGASV
jgi:hypothetical protein